MLASKAGPFMPHHSDTGNPRPSRRAILAGLAGLPSLAGALPARGQQGSRPPLRRGGSIHSALNWPELESGSRDRFLWPPFAHPKYRLDPRLLATFRKAGLDFIRLTVDPGIFLANANGRRAELNAILLSRCRLILDAGMSVIVDFHPNWQVAAWAPDRLITDAATSQAFIALIGDTAEALKPLDARRIALEVFNEPPYGYDAATAARWIKMLRDMHGRARQAHPDLPLVLSGAAGGGVRGLLDIDATAFKDDNIYWSFHYYSPHVFTHQGVVTSQDNMRHFRYLSELPYPSTAGAQAFAELSVRQAIISDASLTGVQRTQMEGAAISTVREYLKADIGAAMIAADFEQAAQWAARNKVDPSRMLLGEFGAARRNEKGNGALNRHREAWLSDVRKEAERRGYAWALWDIDDNQMGLVTARGSGALDQGLVKALGLNPTDK